MTSSPSLPVLRQLLNEAQRGTWSLDEHWVYGADHLVCQGYPPRIADLELIVAVVVIRCDVCGHDDHRTENHAIVADDPEHVPAQPVRDTEEGRRG